MSKVNRDVPFRRDGNNWFTSGRTDWNWCSTTPQSTIAPNCTSRQIGPWRPCCRTRSVNWTTSLYFWTATSRRTASIAAATLPSSGSARRSTIRHRPVDRSAIAGCWRNRRGPKCARTRQLRRNSKALHRRWPGRRRRPRILSTWPTTIWPKLTIWTVRLNAPRPANRLKTTRPTDAKLGIRTRPSTPVCKRRRPNRTRLRPSSAHAARVETTKRFRRHLAVALGATTGKRCRRLRRIGGKAAGGASIEDAPIPPTRRPIPANWTELLRVRGAGPT